MASQGIWQLKLIQLNIWGGKIEHSLLRFVRSQHPDIICMQEVNDLEGSSGAIFATLPEIQRAGNFNDCFMAPTYGYQFQNRKNQFGNAILSTQALMDNDVQFVAGQYTDRFDEETDDFDIRNFQHAAITVRGKNVHIINFHGSFIPGTKAGNDRTLEQVQQIVAYAGQYAEEPIIITGDFNLAPSSESIQYMDDHFRNLSVEYTVSSTYSPVLHVFHEICDYIFVNQYVTVSEFSVSDAVVSDHKALIMEFTV